jgi:hypothetical protein
VAFNTPPNEHRWWLRRFWFRGHTDFHVAGGITFGGDRQCFLTRNVGYVQANCRVGVAYLGGGVCLLSRVVVTRHGIFALEIGCLELDLSRKRAFGGVGTAVVRTPVCSLISACFTIAMGLAARRAIAAAFLPVPTELAIAGRVMLVPGMVALGSVWPLR